LTDDGNVEISGAGLAHAMSGHWLTRGQMAELDPSAVARCKRQRR
jgi:hypothetical protein